jgi:tRNA-dihydrouridine synthase
MIGRAAIGYPWIFREIKHYLKTGEILPPPTLDERIEVCREHLLKSIEWKGEKLGILEMRRHYASYLKGLPHVKEYRTRLVNSLYRDELLQILEELLQLQVLPA